MNRLASDMDGELNVMRLRSHSAGGRELSGPWRLRFTPSYILFDASGAEAWRGVRPPDAAQVRALLDGVE